MNTDYFLIVSSETKIFCSVTEFMKQMTFYEPILCSKSEMHSKTIVVWFPKRM